MKALINIDNCLPDYFRGHHNTVLIAYYDKNTTIGNILDDLESDSNDNVENPEGFTWGEFDKALKVAREENDLDKVYMPDCDFEFSEDNEDDVFPIAYFTLEDI